MISSSITNARSDASFPCFTLGDRYCFRIGIESDDFAAGPTIDRKWKEITPAP